MRAVWNRLAKLNQQPEPMEGKNRNESPSRFSPLDHLPGAHITSCGGVARVVDFAGSWRSLFFYLCTGVIQFAPLKSRGADVRAQYIQEEATPDKPPPCSPKVIYSLASTVGSHIRIRYTSHRLFTAPHPA